MVPTAQSPLGSIDLPVQQMDAFPWERDALILRQADADSAGTGAILEESTASVEEQLAEAYQYLRLTLSQWLIRDARGPATRATLGSLINSNLPLYEKRKRMDIMLEPLVHEWVSVEETTGRKTLSLLRQDCLSLAGEACSDAEGCRWITGEGMSRCLIHAPTRSAANDPIRIFTARLSDELLRYALPRREILNDTVPTIRTPRGSVRVGDELFAATKPKESAQAIMERLGFTGRVAMSFPEEMLRFEGAEEEPVEEGVAEKVVEADDERFQEELPDSWREKGLAIPQPPPGIENVSQLAFAEGTGRPLEKWEEFVKDRRKKLGLEGDPERPLQWSLQDFYVLTALTLSNILFVRRGAAGLIIDRWIQPPSSRAPRIEQSIYMMLWGPRRLLASRGTIYRFKAVDLPADLLDAMDRTRPMPEEEARGYTTEPITLAPAEAPAEAPGPEEEEEEESEEEVPQLEIANAPLLVAAPGPKPSAAEAVVAPILQSAAASVAAASERIATAAQNLVAPIQKSIASLTP
jgi:hypothetical protein